MGAVSKRRWWYANNTKAEKYADVKQFCSSEPSFCQTLITCVIHISVLKKLKKNLQSHLPLNIQRLPKLYLTHAMSFIQATPIAEIKLHDYSPKVSLTLLNWMYIFPQKKLMYIWTIMLPGKWARILVVQWYQSRGEVSKLVSACWW
jgi:hypothetical protein